MNIESEAPQPQKNDIQPEGELNSYLFSSQAPEQNQTHSTNELNQNLSSPQFQNFDDNEKQAVLNHDALKKEQLSEQLLDIKSQLRGYGYDEFGDILNLPIDEIEKCISCFKSVLSQRAKDMEFRKEVYEKIQKMENDKNTRLQMYEKFASGKHHLEAEYDKLQNEHDLLKEALDEEREKFNAEKKKLNEIIVKMKGKEVQYKHEIRNREMQNQKILDQLKKTTERTHSQLKIGFDITGTIENGKITTEESENSMLNKMSDQYHDMKEKVVQENTALKQGLFEVNNQLHQILAEKKEMLVQKGIALKDREKKAINLDDLQILNLNNDVFNLNCTKDAIECLKYNLNKFKEVMLIIDTSNKDIDVEFNFELNSKHSEKTNTIRNLRGLVSKRVFRECSRNYKYIYELQEGLINKFIVKNDDCPQQIREQFNPNGNLLKVLDEKEFESAKNIIIDQEKQLEKKFFDTDLLNQNIFGFNDVLWNEENVLKNKVNTYENTTEDFNNKWMNLKAINDFCEKQIPGIISEDKENLLLNN